jgi:hypothetical protein
MTKVLHQLVVQAQGAHTTVEDRYAYVDYYLQMCIEQIEEQRFLDLLTAEELINCPFDMDRDDLPF